MFEEDAPTAIENGDPNGDAGPEGDASTMSPIR